MSVDALFTPVTMGSLTLRNRIIMAPLTRARATEGHVPMPVMAEYYAQRADCGMIVTEATAVDPLGMGWYRAPGIWTDEQVAGWRKVTDAVHAKGGLVVNQLWHMGRLVHPSFTGGAQPASASATRAPGHAHTYEGRQDLVEARPFTREEIPRVVGDYAQAAKNAIDAGFDGIQLHAANGYLIDQFLRDNSNLRSDDYGGPIENRIRFLLEVIQAVSQTIGADRTSARLSPNGEAQGVDDSDQDTLFTAAAKALSPLGIAFLELRDVGPHGTFGASDRPQVAPLIRRVFKGPLVLNADYTQATGQFMLDSGQADAIAFGRLFIGNPDLPHRFATGAPLAADDMATWYVPGAKGYTDYPTAS